MSFSYNFLQFSLCFRIMTDFFATELKFNFLTDVKEGQLVMIQKIIC